MQHRPKITAGHQRAIADVAQGIEPRESRHLDERLPIVRVQPCAARGRQRPQDQAHLDEVTVNVSLLETSGNAGFLGSVRGSDSDLPRHGSLALSLTSTSAVTN